MPHHRLLPSSPALAPVPTLTLALALGACGPRSELRDNPLLCQSSSGADPRFVISASELDEVLITESVYTHAQDDGTVEIVVGMEVSLESTQAILGFLDPFEYEENQQPEPTRTATQFTDEAGRLRLYLTGLPPIQAGPGAQEVLVLESDCGTEEWTIDLE